MSKEEKTIESFEYQWKHLPDGYALLSDEKFKANVDEYILDELNMIRKEIKGMKVLDAGCGNGRWSYGFAKLGCDVHGFDPSPSGVKYANEHVNGMFWEWDILRPVTLHGHYGLEVFDIIWCWGVIHHTPDPRQAIINLIPLLKPGGIIHLMVYRKKHWRRKVVRWLFRRFSLENQERLAGFFAKRSGRSKHSVFDAHSPEIASEHTFDEITGWLESVACISRIEFKRPEWFKSDASIFVNGYKEE